METRATTGRRRSRPDGAPAWSAAGGDAAGRTAPPRGQRREVTRRPPAALPTPASCARACWVADMKRVHGFFMPLCFPETPVCNRHGGSASVELGSGSPGPRAEAHRHSPACTQVPGDTPSGGRKKGETRSPVVRPAFPSPPRPSGPTPVCTAGRAAAGPGVGASSQQWGCQQAADGAQRIWDASWSPRPPLRTTFRGRRGQPGSSTVQSPSRSCHTWRARDPGQGPLGPHQAPAQEATGSTLPGPEHGAGWKQAACPH